MVASGVEARVATEEEAEEEEEATRVGDAAASLPADKRRGTAMAVLLLLLLDAPRLQQARDAREGAIVVDCILEVQKRGG